MPSTKKPSGAKNAASNKMGGVNKMGGANKAGGVNKPAGANKPTGAKKPTATAATVSFAKDIAPLFRPQDVQCMRNMNVLLLNYGWMSQPSNAQMVYGKLMGTAPGNRMPDGGPYWSQQNLNLFNQWMTGGYQP
jgi:hypothetical protein